MYCHELATLIEQLETRLKPRCGAPVFIVSNQAESLDDLRQVDKLPKSGKRWVSVCNWRPINTRP